MSTDKSSETSVSLRPEASSAEKSTTLNVSPKVSDPGVLWVDWDGPNDSMNPKKQVVATSSSILTDIF